MAAASLDLLVQPANAEVEGPDFVERIHCEFGGALKRYLLRNLSTEADAEDMLHEVYLRLARCESPLYVHNPKAFVFTTATNLLRDHSRRLATRLERASLSCSDFDLPARTGDPGSALEYQEELARVAVAIGELKPACREAFLMNRFDDLTYVAIAERMGISVSMVEKHVSAALRALREVRAGPEAGC